MVKYYRLENNQPVECFGEIEYYKWLDSQPWRKRTTTCLILAMDGPVITFFLGTKDNSKSGKSLFATFVNGNQIEHESYDEAMVAHRELVTSTRAGEGTYRRKRKSR